LSVHHPSVAGVFPLAERVLAIKDMAVRYERIVRDIMGANFTVARLEHQMAAIESVIGDAAAAEPSAIVSKAPPLRQFVVDRVKAVTGQLDGRRRGAPARAPSATPRTN
jgi:hypothetical protein